MAKNLVSRVKHAPCKEKNSGPKPPYSSAELIVMAYRKLHDGKSPEEIFGENSLYARGVYHQ